MPGTTHVPRVSVLMPTYRHADFIRRALASLRAQSFEQWELIIVDDGSPDCTAALVQEYLHDQRIVYHRLDRNRGVGVALNTAVGLAKGEYLAYLPSDDLWYPDHLNRLVTLLDQQPETYLAYGGLVWNRRTVAPTLHGAEAVGREPEYLENPPVIPENAPLHSGNLLALVQVMHRRSFENDVRWTERSVVVSDDWELDFYRRLVQAGAHFAYAGAITCEWVAHAGQLHKRIQEPHGSLARFRAYYNVADDEWLNWQPSRGILIDEKARFGRFAVPRDLPASGGLKILLVGELGFNPERIMALEEHGHKLYGLWAPDVQGWDNAGPFPWGNITTIPYTPGWIEQVRDVKPDVIYGMLNAYVIPQLSHVFTTLPEIPFVLHFKESQFIALENGTWPQLMHLLHASAGQIYISQENFDWFQLATDHGLDPASALILDGDLPKNDWMTSNWAPKLSAHDDEIHTVCSGRPLGLDPFEDIAAAGIHVHFYGKHFQEWFPDWTRSSLSTGYLHQHTTVQAVDWVRELSQYDAAWPHIFSSQNQGNLQRADWDDLNLAARIGTYAFAGLPWILKDNRRAVVSIQSIAMLHDIGVFFTDYRDLARQLRDRTRLAQLTSNMRAARHHFAFDTHVPRLIEFFRGAIERHRSSS
ncbi:MAG: hypothetical protein NVSMB42_19010 [Herpetosiphon sp.]